MRCYCSICRKTAGGGGYAINLGAAARSMKVTGKRDLRIYQAQVPDKDSTGTNIRHLACAFPHSVIDGQGAQACRHKCPARSGHARPLLPPPQ